MNIHKFGCQERIQQNHGLGYGLDYAKKFDSQEKPNQMGIFQGGSSQQHSFAPANSSTTIMSQIGSPGSAFYATEIYMGFTQYDYQHSICPQISKNFDDDHASYQQSGDGFYSTDQSLEQTNPSLPSANSCTNNQYDIASDKYSEREQILQLKRKLLGDYDTPDNKRQASVPFDGNSDLSLSHNPYGFQQEHTRQSPGNAAAPSAPAVMSSKTRIRWSQDLHDRFVKCVTRLGGAEKATPKAILKLMDSEGMTIYHVKSHLQKYRIAKYMPDSAQGGKPDKRTSMNDVEQIDIKTGMQLKEALQLQLDVQRRLHEQLEIQRNLQLRIEEQGKQLKLMFDQQQKVNKSVF